LDALGAEDEVDAFAALFADGLVHLRVRAHPEHLRKHERGDAVAVHARAILAAEVAVGFLSFWFDDELQRLLHRLSLSGAIARLVSERSKGERGEGGHGCFVAQFVVNPAGHVLLPDKVLGGALERFIHGCGLILKRGARRELERAKQGQRDAADRGSRIEYRISLHCFFARSAMTR
jgi:hypothetical protein